MWASIQRWPRAAKTSIAAAVLLAFCASPALGEPVRATNAPPDVSARPPVAPSHALAASDALFADDFDEDWEEPSDDPLEPVNRKIFTGNRWLDRAVLDPVARCYGWAVPDAVKRAVRGVFENLNQPAIAVNDLLQREPKRAGSAGARFVVNTTVGLLGIWDPATRMGLEAHEADFGQTLGKAGVGAGPYLVLPVFGPSTSRDLVGSVVDLAMRPDTWLFPLGTRLVLASTNGITRKEENLESVRALEDSSVDFYSALRSAYLQSREAMIEDSSALDAAPPAAPEPVLAPEADSAL